MARARNYQSPGVIVRQVFTDDLSAVAVAANVHISGPHTNVISEADGNLEEGFLGTYSADDGIYVELPSVVRGSIVKQDATRVLIKNALLRYYENNDAQFFIPANSKNMVSAGSVLTDKQFSFRTNGLYPRYIDFYDRDARTGDVVELTADVDGQLETFVTTIASFEPNLVPGEVGTVEPDVNNPGSNTGTVTFDADASTGTSEPTVGGLNDWGEYYRTQGFLTDVYTLKVTTAAAAGVDSKFSFTSASGYSEQNISATADTGIFRVALGNSDVAVSWEDTVTFDAGETFVFNVTYDTEVPYITVGGTYAAAASTGQPRTNTYIITVTKSGKIPSDANATGEELRNAPTLSVQTADGSDKTPLVRVTQKRTDITISRYGVTASFDNDYLVAGSKFYVTVYSPYTSYIPSLILNKNLPASWLDSDPRDVNVKFYLVDEQLEVGEHTMTSTGRQTNWTLDQTEGSIQVKSNLELPTPSFTQGGIPVPLPVFGFESNKTGRAYLETVYYVNDLVNRITPITSLALLNSTISGPTDSRNPLKLAAFYAIANGAGSQVLVTSVADPDNIQEWQNVTDLISDRDDVFHVLPLTQGRQNVIDLFYQHTLVSNQDEAARERVLYIISGDSPIKSILTDNYGDVVLGKLSVEQGIGTTTYLAYSVETEGIDFNDLGVRPGDELRTRYDYDESGAEIYKSFKVDSIINGGMVRLVEAVTSVGSGAVTADAIPLRFEIWRTETNDEFADSIAATAGIQSHLVRYIYTDNADPDFDQITTGAALVGLIGSVVPHQGVSWYPLSGISADPWTQRFSKTQLDHMGGNGVLLITPLDSDVVARHAVTTNKAPLASEAQTNLNLKLTEEMFIRNMLLLKKEFRTVVRRGYVGVTNNVEGTYAAIEHALNVRADILRSSINYPMLGGRITSGPDNLVIEPHAILSDRLWISFTITGPLPLNGLEMTIYC
jgi:hypothetical protein